MIDPLAEVVSLLRPAAPSSKLVSGAGRWRVRRTDYDRPFYCAILEGECRLAVDGHAAITLRPGDFVLLPSALSFTLSDAHPVSDTGTPSSPSLVADTEVHLLPGEIRHGVKDGPPDARWLVGYCVFESPDAAMLVSLIPQLIHVRGDERLATLVKLVGDESRAQRPARDMILCRLLEVLLIEALRSAAGTGASPGLVRGLADERLSVAIRRMHEHPARPWTVAQLAAEAALSRSGFFERFQAAVGVAPMQYLLGWRMALAKDLLRKEDAGVAQVAERVGYGSASAFSVAFTRHVGIPPMAFARSPAG